MKRHSTTGPDAVYPAHERQVILFRPDGSWLVGLWDEQWDRFHASAGTRIRDVVAWSDPTEADDGGMVPTGWLDTIGAYIPHATKADWDRIGANTTMLVPLYATPPNTAPVWRPIETAPKTSKAQLVWVPENKCIFCVSWADPTGWHIFGGGWREHLQRATHWMPLPADPGESAPTIDHTAVMRQAVEALEGWADTGNGWLSFSDVTKRIEKRDAALAALRGALPGGV